MWRQRTSPVTRFERGDLPIALGNHEELRETGSVHDGTGRAPGRARRDARREPDLAGLDVAEDDLAVGFDARDARRRRDATALRGRCAPLDGACVAIETRDLARGADHDALTAQERRFEVDVGDGRDPPRRKPHLAAVRPWTSGVRDGPAPNGEGLVAVRLRVRDRVVFLAVVHAVRKRVRGGQEALEAEIALVGSVVCREGFAEPASECDRRGGEVEGGDGGEGDGFPGVHAGAAANGDVERAVARAAAYSDAAFTELNATEERAASLPGVEGLVGELEQAFGDQKRKGAGDLRDPVSSDDGEVAAHEQRVEIGALHGRAARRDGASSRRSSKRRFRAPAEPAARRGRDGDRRAIHARVRRGRPRRFERGPSGEQRVPDGSLRAARDARFGERRDEASAESLQRDAALVNGDLRRGPRAKHRQEHVVGVALQTELPDVVLGVELNDGSVRPRCREARDRVCEVREQGQREAVRDARRDVDAVDDDIEKTVEWGECRTWLGERPDDDMESRHTWAQS